MANKEKCKSSGKTFLKRNVNPGTQMPQIVINPQIVVIKAKYKLANFSYVMFFSVAQDNLILSS